MMSLRKSILACESGASLMLIGLMFMLVMLAAGIALDMGRIYAVESKAQNAADAALLGAVATRSTSDIKTEMTQMFKANYPADYMGSKIDIENGMTLTETNQDSGNSHTYTATLNFPVTVPMTLMGLFGQPEVTIDILSQVVNGYNDTTNATLELALVLDNTGSMGAAAGGVGGLTKMDALKRASQDLVNILFGGAPASDKIHVSVVPYDIVVKISSATDPIENWHQDWIQMPESFTKFMRMMTVYKGGFAFNRHTDYLCGPKPIQSCWPARDVPAHDETYCSGGCPASCTPWDENNCNPETGACTTTHHTCPPAGPCTPVVCNTVHVPAQHVDAGCYNGYDWQYVCKTDNKLSDVTDEPPTAGDQYKFRLPWESWYLDTPVSLGSGEDSAEYHKYLTSLAPLKFGLNEKALIESALGAMQISGATRVNVGLMWGWFTLSPKWKGLWDTQKPDLPADASPTLNKAIVLMTDGKNIFGGDDERTLALCNAIKAQGMTLYTVGFGSGGQVNQELLRSCASLPTYFWLAPTADDLRTAFHAIGDSLNYNTVRLSQ